MAKNSVVMFARGNCKRLRVIGKEFANIVKILDARGNAYFLIVK
jgi:hypothetical protein